METSVGNAKLIYINKYNNTCLTDGNILEMIRRKSPDETVKDVIFDLYAKILTRSIEQRIVYKYLIYEENSISITKLCDILASRYNKSARTYRRAIENLNKGKIIKLSKGIISLNIDYDLSLLDLDKTKSLIIHII